MKNDDRTPTERAGRILQYVGMALFFIPFMVIPLGIACAAATMGEGSVGVPKVFVAGPASMCVGFGGFALIAIGGIMSRGAQTRVRLESSWPTDPGHQAEPTVKHEYPPVERRGRCQSCGAPPSSGKRCDYCGTYY